MQESRPHFDSIQIMKLLPHRFPFLMVDRVDEVKRESKGSGRVGWSIRAVKNVSINEPFFAGHFPHRPVMPGVLQIEALAQCAALIVVDLEGPRMDVAIAGVNEARFRRPVVPGDTLDLTAEVMKDRGQILVVKCEAHVRGQLVAECEMIAKMFPLELQ